MTTKNTENSKNTKTRTIIIIIVAILVVAGLSVGTYFIIKNAISKSKVTKTSVDVKLNSQNYQTLTNNADEIVALLKNQLAQQLKLDKTNTNLLSVEMFNKETFQVNTDNSNTVTVVYLIQPGLKTTVNVENALNSLDKSIESTFSTQNITTESISKPKVEYITKEEASVNPPNEIAKTKPSKPESDDSGDSGGSGSTGGENFDCKCWDCIDTKTGQTITAYKDKKTCESAGFTVKCQNISKDECDCKQNNKIWKKGECLTQEENCKQTDNSVWFNNKCNSSLVYCETDLKKEYGSCSETPTVCDQTIKNNFNNDNNMMSSTTYNDLCNKCVSESTCNELKCKNSGNIWDNSASSCNSLENYCEKVLSVDLGQQLKYCPNVVSTNSIDLTGVNVDLTSTQKSSLEKHCMPSQLCEKLTCEQDPTKVFDSNVSPSCITQEEECIDDGNIYENFQMNLNPTYSNNKCKTPALFCNSKPGYQYNKNITSSNQKFNNVNAKQSVKNDLNRHCLTFDEICMNNSPAEKQHPNNDSTLNCISTKEYCSLVPPPGVEGPVNYDVNNNMCVSESVFCADQNPPMLVNPTSPGECISYEDNCKLTHQNGIWVSDVSSQTNQGTCMQPKTYCETNLGRVYDTSSKTNFTNDLNLTQQQKNTMTNSAEELLDQNCISQENNCKFIENDVWSTVNSPGTCEDPQTYCTNDLKLKYNENYNYTGQLSPQIANQNVKNSMSPSEYNTFKQSCITEQQACTINNSNTNLQCSAKSNNWSCPNKTWDPDTQTCKSQLKEYCENICDFTWSNKTTNDDYQNTYFSNYNCETDSTVKDILLRQCLSSKQVCELNGGTFVESDNLCMTLPSGFQLTDGMLHEIQININNVPYLLSNQFSNSGESIKLINKNNTPDGNPCGDNPFACRWYITQSDQQSDTPLYQLKNAAGGKFLALNTSTTPPTFTMVPSNLITQGGLYKLISLSQTQPVLINVNKTQIQGFVDYNDFNSIGLYNEQLSSNTNNFTNIQNISYKRSSSEPWETLGINDTFVSTIQCDITIGGNTQSYTFTIKKIFTLIQSSATGGENGAQNYYLYVNNTGKYKRKPVVQATPSSQQNDLSGQTNIFWSMTEIDPSIYKANCNLNNNQTCFNSIECSICSPPSETWTCARNSNISGDLGNSYQGTCKKLSSIDDESMEFKQFEYGAGKIPTNEYDCNNINGYTLGESSDDTTQNNWLWIPKDNNDPKLQKIISFVQSPAYGDGIYSSNLKNYDGICVHNNCQNCFFNSDETGVNVCKSNTFNLNYNDLVAKRKSWFIKNFKIDALGVSISYKDIFGKHLNRTLQEVLGTPSTTYPNITKSGSRVNGANIYVSNSLFKGSPPVVTPSQIDKTQFELSSTNTSTPNDYKYILFDFQGNTSNNFQLSSISGNPNTCSQYPAGTLAYCADDDSISTCKQLNNLGSIGSGNTFSISPNAPIIIDGNIKEGDKCIIENQYALKDWYNNDKVGLCCTMNNQGNLTWKTGSCNVTDSTTCNESTLGTYNPNVTFTNSEGTQVTGGYCCKSYGCQTDTVYQWRQDNCNIIPVSCNDTIQSLITSGAPPSEIETAENNCSVGFSNLRLCNDTNKNTTYMNTDTEQIKTCAYFNVDQINSCNKLKNETNCNQNVYCNWDASNNSCKIIPNMSTFSTYSNEYTTNFQTNPNYDTAQKNQHWVSVYNIPQQSSTTSSVRTKNYNLCDSTQSNSCFKSTGSIPNEYCLPIDTKTGQNGGYTGICNTCGTFKSENICNGHSVKNPFNDTTIDYPCVWDNSTNSCNPRSPPSQ